MSRGSFSLNSFSGFILIDLLRSVKRMAKARSSKVTQPTASTDEVRTVPSNSQVNIAVDELGVRIMHPYSDGEIVRSFDSGHTTRVREGLPVPLGATWDGLGVNFALFSANATKVELCLFNDEGEQYDVIELPEYTDQVWHGYLPDARPGMLYGYRVYGPYDPAHGHRFNHHKLLVDPYAKELFGTVRWSDAHYGYRIGGTRGDLSFDRRDDASGMPKCVVVDTAFTWGMDRRPNVSWKDTIFYELHVRGFTQMHPDVPPALRGTFAGLSSPAVINYLVDLGITTVELPPVHAFVDDRFLVERRLRNYWGYNSLAFFAPETRYITGGINEFKTMVKHLHEAGIEVVLDVVYNHTA